MFPWAADTGPIAYKCLVVVLLHLYQEEVKSSRLEVHVFQTPPPAEISQIERC